MTLVDLYLVAGVYAHPIVLLSLAGLLFAWRIQRKRLGLRHRFAFLLMAFLPLLAAIFFASANAVISARGMRQVMRNPQPPLGELHYRAADDLSIIIFGAFGSLVLLGTSSLLLLSKHAEARPAA